MKCTKSGVVFLVGDMITKEKIQKLLLYFFLGGGGGAQNKVQEYTLA